MTANNSKRLTIAVVICAHNEEAWIPITLASLIEQRRQADEIVVVDNASTDGTAHVVQQFIDRHPGCNIRIVCEPHKGLWRARDAGWKATSPGVDVIASTDADITFPADWLERIERRFEDAATQAITGVWHYTGALPFINWTNDYFNRLSFKAGEWQLFGANSAIRRHVLEEIDGYAGKPVDAFEDQYITRKIEAAGYKIQYLLDLRVWHPFRRFSKEGLTGYLRYMAVTWDAEAIYPDHLSDDSPYTVSVVIGTANSERVIGRCLESLAAQRPLPNEIIVVDAHSTDGTGDLVRTFLDSHPALPVRLLEGAADAKQARVMGWAAATQELVVPVEPDLIFPENWLARIHVAFVCTRQLGALGGEIRFAPALSLRRVRQTLHNFRIRWRNRRSVRHSGDLMAYRREAAMRPEDADYPAPICQIEARGYRVRFKRDLYAVRKPAD